MSPGLAQIMLIVLVKNTSKSDLTRQQNLGLCWGTDQALGLCRVIQEWNCILWNKLYWDCCLHGGLWHLFLERIAPRRALHMLCVCVKLPEVTGELFLSGWFSLIYTVSKTLYSFLCSSLNSSSKVTRTLNLGLCKTFISVSLQSGVRPVLQIGAKGKKSLGYLKQSSENSIYWAVIIGR